MWPNPTSDVCPSPSASWPMFQDARNWGNPTHLGSQNSITANSQDWVNGHSLSSEGLRTKEDSQENVRMRQTFGET